MTPHEALQRIKLLDRFRGEPFYRQAEEEVLGILRELARCETCETKAPEFVDLRGIAPDFTDGRDTAEWIRDKWRRADAVAQGDGDGGDGAAECRENEERG